MDFLEIHDRFYERVRRYIRASVRDDSAADDLVQETFARVQENVEGVRDPAKLSSWIFRIAHNLCRDHFRRLKKSPAAEPEAGGRMAALQEPPAQKKVEQEEMSRCVQDQLALLPEALRSVLLLADVMDFNHQEISEILGISVENAKVRLHRARRKFKSILEEKCTFEVDERSILVCEPVEKKKGRGK